MAAPKNRQAAKETPAVQAAPPYYIAVQPLFIGKFGRAFNPGDMVPVEHVATYGWQHLVRLPDGYENATDQPASEPETDDGQATTSSEGKDA